ncbi:MAG: CdaR family protein [Chloroflexota bacterium]|nr:CdaR family protein [Chloroflexota bacterium]
MKAETSPATQSDLTTQEGAGSAVGTAPGLKGRAAAPSRKVLAGGRKLLPQITRVAYDDRVGRLLLSVLLAVLLWFYVVNLENPVQTSTFKALPLDVRGGANGLRVVNSLPIVDAEVQAPASTINTLRSTDVRPYVDLSGLGPGEHVLPVHADIAVVQPGGVSVNLSPATVSLQLEVPSSHTYPVTVKMNGTPAIGYGVEPAQVEPAQVKVIGSKEAVDQVNRVLVPVDVDEKAGTQRAVATPVAQDAAGNEVKGVIFDPPTVQIVVPIKLLLNYKAVPVRVPIVGQPGAGYRVSAIAVDPTNVTICCSPNLQDTLQFLDTRPVAITGATYSVITTTELLLPPGIALYPGQAKTVSVTVNVEPLVTTLQLSVAPTANGLAPGSTAVISPNKLDVILAGTFDQLQSLKPTDVQAYVDVQGKSPGTYELPLQVVVPQGVKVDKMAPDHVTVTVLSSLQSTATAGLPTETAVPPIGTAVPTP